MTYTNHRSWVHGGDSRIATITDPDPELDGCDHCREAGVATIGAWEVNDSAWLSNTGEPLGDGVKLAGTATTLCHDCLAAVYGCLCGCLHFDDFRDQDWLDGAEEAHDALIDAATRADTTTEPLSAGVAAASYRVAWLAYVEAANRASLLSRDARVPAVLPHWQAARRERDAAYEIRQFAQARLRESLLAIGCTETSAAWRRSQIERSAKKEIGR